MDRSLLDTKLANRVISANLNGIKMKKYAKDNNLDKEQAKQVLIDFVCCGRSISLGDFLAERSANG